MRIAPLVALSVVGLLAGCGGNDDDAATSTTTTTSVVTSSPSATTPATDTATSAGTPTSGTSTSGGAATYTMADVASHKDQSSCWTVIDGKVYDVTPWISQHPGGPDRILGLCGQDGSSAFHNQHDGDSTPPQRLATFQIGTLKQ